jgi:hypothetical protein
MSCSKLKKADCEKSGTCTWVVGKGCKKTGASPKKRSPKKTSSRKSPKKRSASPKKRSPSPKKKRSPKKMQSPVLYTFTYFKQYPVAALKIVTGEKTAAAAASWLSTRNDGMKKYYDEKLKRVVNELDEQKVADTARAGTFKVGDKVVHYKKTSIEFGIIREMKKTSALVELCEVSVSPSRIRDSYSYYPEWHNMTEIVKSISFKELNQYQDKRALEGLGYLITKH